MDGLEHSPKRAWAQRTSGILMLMLLEPVQAGVAVDPLGLITEQD